MNRIRIYETSSIEEYWQIVFLNGKHLKLEQLQTLFLVKDSPMEAPKEPGLAFMNQIARLVGEEIYIGPIIMAKILMGIHIIIV